MADTTIATDIHETLDVHLNRGAELTLDLVLFVDLGTDLGNLIVVPVTHFDGSIDTAFVQDLPGGAAADTEDIGQTYLSLFVVK